MDKSNFGGKPKRANFAVNTLAQSKLESKRGRGSKKRLFLLLLNNDE